MKNHQTWIFGVQVFFSTIVLGLCTFKLVADKAPNNQALYWGGLTGVLAYWLPAPTSSKNEEQQFLLRNQYSLNQTSNNGLVEQSKTSQQTIGVSKTEE
ncbi:MAG: hypothetical protein KME30_15240 [Iphinoe sp. HA4291-MV1]|jgi:hypothetical protein|nr:hypothetical protein [Iphinoe sp. HA4291-MV1]